VKSRRALFRAETPATPFIPQKFQKIDLFLKINRQNAPAAIRS